jgi:pilus assembly protein CpaE
VMATSVGDSDVLSAKMTSVALIGPDGTRRSLIANSFSELQNSVTREFDSYPGLDDVPQLLEAGYDVVVIELDSDAEHALDLVESICSKSLATVMVYSEKMYPEMLVRCMRAGAREFLTPPITASTIAEALIRASVRRPPISMEKKVEGKQLLFIGAKGGSGVTTVATNFAVSLCKESGKKILLLDLNFPLGDAALTLGIHAQYSAANALQNADRLDFNFLSTLLMEHSSGLFVLAAPDTYSDEKITHHEVAKLLSVARQSFDYIVIDGGSKFGPMDSSLLEDSATVYLVTQVSVSDLRNCNRLISELLALKGVKPEIVLNRFIPHALGIDEESLTKALTMPAQWKIPNDTPAAQTAQNTATPLALGDSPISRAIQQMTRKASGSPAVKEKKKRFGWFA